MKEENTFAFVSARQVFTKAIFRSSAYGLFFSVKVVRNVLIYDTFTNSSSRISDLSGDGVGVLVADGFEVEVMVCRQMEVTTFHLTDCPLIK